jgi:hypothetical protein
MSEYINISLPDAIADELISEKLAVRQRITRSPGLGEVFSVTVDCINTGSAVVSIALAITALRRLARTVIERRHPADPDIVTITVKAADQSKVLTVDRSESTAESEVLDFLIDALNPSHADTRK